MCLDFDSSYKFRVLETSPVTFERDLARRNLLAPVVLVGDATGDDLTLEKVQATFNFKVSRLNLYLYQYTQTVDFSLKLCLNRLTTMSTF